MPSLSRSRMRRRINQLSKKLPTRSIVFDGNVGLEDTVILASMGRSGSTLVSSIINCDNTYRLLFEPFRFDRVREAKHFVYPFYLRPENTAPHLFRDAQKIMTGNVHAQWIDQENKAVFPKKRLIKDIRINMMLKWLHNGFPKVKIVLLVRHPCAVVESWMAARFGMGPVACERLCANEWFMEDINGSIMDEYRRAEPGFESLVFLWCVSYWVPFHQLGKDEVHLLFYEDLLIDPQKELEALFSFLGQSYNPRKALRVLTQPSSTTRANSDVFLKGYKFDSWRAHVTSGQLDRMYEIMSLFGMEKLYSPTTGRPNREIALNFFGTI